MQISSILDQIDHGSLTLPVFQRGYVWNREQIRKLFASLYKKYPVGTLLVWETSSANAKNQDNMPIPHVPVNLLLDGQQRITSLYAVIRGYEPKFFNGDPNKLEGLYFNIEDESFEFYQSNKMKDDPRWINISNLFGEKFAMLPKIAAELNEVGFDNTGEYIGRLYSILSIPDYDIHTDRVTGSDKTVEEVVEIFKLINSEGTSLTDGDLALAKISVNWPEVRESMQQKLRNWENSNYSFTLDWLLRVMNAIIYERAKFGNLHNTSSTDVQNGLKNAEIYIDKILNWISSRLGLDHDRVLFAKHAIPVISVLFHKYSSKLTPERRDKILYWYVQAGMWGRFSGSTESTLEQDLSIIANSTTVDDSIDKLIEVLKLSRGGLRVEAQNFHGSTRGDRFYPVLYMLTRIGEAKDFCDGLPLKKGLLGKMAQLEHHHIFPKARLKAEGRNKQEINALANFCFLKKDCNLRIGKRLPEDYFTDIIRDNPGALESQWIPMDRNLWKLENYDDFLEARKLLLAEAFNRLLSDLHPGHEKATNPILSVVQRPHSISDDEEESEINKVNEWVKENGLQDGIIGYDLINSATGELMAILDIAWPDGLQSELSGPVALLINEEADVLKAAGSQGFRFFTTPEEFKDYVTNEIIIDSPKIPT